MGFISVFVVGALLSLANCHPDGNRQRFVKKDLGSGHPPHDISIQNAPYLAAIYQHENWSSHLSFRCSASIIHEQFVLTAGDCCRFAKNKFKILVGADKYDKWNESDGQILEIDQIIVHKKFDFLYMDFNVCLIKLKETLTFGPKVGKIALAKQGFNLSAGSTLNATGWWKYGESVDKLYQIELPLVAKKICEEERKKDLFRSKITPRDICAGGSGYWQRDSGSPLTLGDLQVGVSTTRRGLGLMPSVYTRVASVAAWIDRQIEEFQ